MVTFFRSSEDSIYAVSSSLAMEQEHMNKLVWLFNGAECLERSVIPGKFIGPRKEMVTPWSTNAVEITQNMGISGIERIELFIDEDSVDGRFDAMLQVKYNGLDQNVFIINRIPDPVMFIDDIAAYNIREGLALSTGEIEYLNHLSDRIGRRLTDSEIFGFSQVNSEHCRHKIFNGTFVIDKVSKEYTLFQLIKNTTATNTNRVVSAYRDNCAFISGPTCMLFSPASNDKPDFFSLRPVDTVISLKAETHNFPTTVEPFNGAATGSGGEIRDRMAGGKGAFPLAGTAVYMTAYPRLEAGRAWEKHIQPRKWLYQTPGQILIKASNGASDFGNKFGQPLVCGSLLTFEHAAENKMWAYDKVIMLAGGIGFAIRQNSMKDQPVKGDKIILLGGDNYRIGMGGGAVSSVATGEYDHAIELNAVQRSNPEMQKRVCNAIRALAESEDNPIISIHDHGAGGHLNCFSELVEQSGGEIEIGKLPIGDPTLSAREIIGNESQERMGLILDEQHTFLLRKIAERERSPMYVVGEVTGNRQFTFRNKDGSCPIDLQLEDMFGNPPKSVLRDETIAMHFEAPEYDLVHLDQYLENVLQLEAVACKDWLTNKVDRSVTGLVAKQQTCGPVQLPLNDLGVVSIDYTGYKGVATAIGHAPLAGIVDPACGSVLSIAEALTNIIWAPIEGGIRGISLSANWMWPCRNPGEDARLYVAVQATSEFAIALGINIPTGKDSLSMTQKYRDGSEVFAPGTVIISAACEVKDIRKVVEPVIKPLKNKSLLYIGLSRDSFKLGGSCFAQSMNKLGDEPPTVRDSGYFSRVFDLMQELIGEGKILAGHDISAGGLIVTLLEMCFARPGAGMQVDLDEIPENDLIKILFSENPGLVIQVDPGSRVTDILQRNNITYYNIGTYVDSGIVSVRKSGKTYSFDAAQFRKIWFKTSYLLDRDQSGPVLAEKRFVNYAKQSLQFRFNPSFTGKISQFGLDKRRMTSSGIKSAIIREKGVNGDREMAYLMYLAGFDVKDVHMTDLIYGRETLDDIKLIVFVGGFSNSDVLGSAKGWAGAFLYNEKARIALDRYYAREDTLSLGVCNGCQLMMELELITPGHEEKPRMLHNASRKFESAFIAVNIPDNHSVMLRSLAGSTLGIWVAHGEGRFSLPLVEERYNVGMKYRYGEYPGNPNGSDYNVAGIYSNDGRHLAVMPHLERSVYPWNWAYYPENRQQDEVTPWIEAFVNAAKWIKGRQSSR
jgi:phosphoribosylformylglycinamidine synthase